MIPLTGTQHEISAGDYEAVITQLGAGLRELRYQGHQVIASYPPDELPPGAAGQLLLPWPNRIDGGRYTAAGQPCQLDLSEPSLGTAIHGLTRWATWAPVRSEPGMVSLREVLLGRSGYPFCLEIEAEYQLSEQGLRVCVSARNVGSRPAPYGTGSHPYLTAGTAVVDACELTLPATQWLPAGERGIPAGPPKDVAGGEFDFRTPRLIGPARIDHAFTGLQTDGQGRAWARLAAGGRAAAGGHSASPGDTPGPPWPATPRWEVALWAGPGYRWLQVFTGDTLDDTHRRRALAIEPMTCPPNAFASGIDLIMLEPGDAVTHTWGIQVTGRPAAG